MLATVQLSERFRIGIGFIFGYELSSKGSSSQALLGTLIGGEPVTVSTRAVSMWLQLALPRMGSARRPFKNLTSLDLSSSSCGFVVLSATL